jgi:hypothetical protein
MAQRVRLGVAGATVLLALCACAGQRPVLSTSAATASARSSSAVPAKSAASAPVELDPVTVELAGGHYLKVGAFVYLIGPDALSDAERIVVRNVFTTVLAKEKPSSVTAGAMSRLNSELQSAVSRALPGRVSTLAMSGYVLQ